MTQSSGVRIKPLKEVVQDLLDLQEQAENEIEDVRSNAENAISTLGELREELEDLLYRLEKEEPK